MHHLLISQAVNSDGRHVDHLPQHIHRVDPGEPVGQRVHFTELFDQLLQRVIGNARCILIHVQAGVFQGGLGQVAIQCGIVLQVLLLLATFHFVQWRLGNIDITALNQLRHLAEKERQQQGANVGAVHIGIGHDDDVVVAQFVDIELSAADATA